MRQKARFWRWSTATQKKLAEVVDAIAAEGGGVQAFTTELRDPASIAATFSQINEQVGSPDILVNNAGIDTTSDVVDMPTALWDEMIEINLRSVFLCTRQVLPDMVARKWGRIINTASQLGHKGAPQTAHYAAAKARLSPSPGRLPTRLLHAALR